MAELRFDPSNLCFFSIIFIAQLALAFSWSCVCLGPTMNGWPRTLDPGKGFQHLLGVTRPQGVWLVAGTLTPTLLSAVPRLGSVWACGFLSLKGGCPWAVEVAGIGWRLDVGSLFSLSLVLVSIL